MDEPPFVQAVMAELKASLARAALDPRQAAQIVESLEEYIVRHWGGERPYVISFRRWQIERRNEWIKRHFNGRNQEDLCRQWGISERTLRRVVNGE